jgi:hypothetical protein
MTATNQGNLGGSPILVEPAFCQGIDALLIATKRLPPEADSPIGFYLQTSNEILSILQALGQTQNTDPLLDEAQEGHLRCFALSGLVECLERFSKEVAAVCIDELVQIDSRCDSSNLCPSPTVWAISPREHGSLLKTDCALYLDA